MWSCFEDLVVRKIMVRSKFNPSVWFNSYSFLVLDLHACGDVIMFIHFCMHAHITYQQAQQSNINEPAQTIIMLLRRWFREISPQVMDSHPRIQHGLHEELKHSEKNRIDITFPTKGAEKHRPCLEPNFFQKSLSHQKESYYFIILNKICL